MQDKLKQTTLDMLKSSESTSALSSKSCTYTLCVSIYVIVVGVASRSNDDIKVTDLQSSIKEKFLVDMPQDFYDFWEFCKDLNHTAPEGNVTTIYSN